MVFHGKQIRRVKLFGKAGRSLRIAYSEGKNDPLQHSGKEADTSGNRYG